MFQDFVQTERSGAAHSVSRQIDPIGRDDLWGRSLGLAPTLDQEAGSPELSTEFHHFRSTSITEVCWRDAVASIGNGACRVSPASRSLVWSHSAASSAQLSMVRTCSFVRPHTLPNNPQFKQMRKPNKPPHPLVGLYSFVCERWQAMRSFLLVI